MNIIIPRIFQQTKLWKITALITMCCFVFTSVLGDVFVEAASERLDRGQAQGPAPTEIANSTITVPPALGTIKDSFLLSHQKPAIIHIQDAHCNYFAQRKIAEIIDYFHEKYGIDTVNLEGGEGKYDLSSFTDIKDSVVREKVSDYFVKQGLVNGAEYCAINNPGKVKLWGVEDTELYLENLNIYRDFLTHKDEADAYIKELEDIFGKLKKEIYSEELLEFDEKYNEYKENNLKFEDYIAYLEETVLKKNVSLKGFLNISILIKTLNVEQNIAFERANKEREVLIDELRRRISKNSLKKFITKTVEFKKKLVPVKEFYAFLIHEAKVVNITLERFPQLQKYVEYIALYESMDKSVLMDEITHLEDKIKEALCENNKQKKLVQLSKNLILTKNLFNITLTKEDYKYYKANEKSFDIKNYVSFIKQHHFGKSRNNPDVIPENFLETKNLSGIYNLNNFRRHLSQFYNYSFQRDQAFLKNITNRSFPRKRESLIPNTNHESPTTILITGGFHTENLTELFKKNNIPYITIMPNFKNSKNYKSQYFNLLSGRKMETLKALLPEVSNLALYTDFCENVVKVYSLEEREAKALWRQFAQAIFEEKKDITIHGRKYSFFRHSEAEGRRISIPIKNLKIDGKQVYTNDGLYFDFTVLLIEDNWNESNPHNEGDEYKAKLEKKGYRVIGKKSGDEALKFLKNTQEHISLILTDYDMPGTKVINFAKVARKLGITIPIILHTKNDDVIGNRYEIAPGEFIIGRSKYMQEGLSEVDRFFKKVSSHTPGNNRIKTLIFTIPFIGILLANTRIANSAPFKFALESSKTIPWGWIITWITAGAIVAFIAYQGIRSYAKIVNEDALSSNYDDGQHTLELTQTLEIQKQRITLAFIVTSFFSWLYEYTARQRNYTYKPKSQFQDVREFFKEITRQTNGKNSFSQISNYFSNKFFPATVNYIHRHAMYHTIENLSNFFIKNPIKKLLIFTIPFIGTLLANARVANSAPLSFQFAVESFKATPWGWIAGGLIAAVVMSFAVYRVICSRKGRESIVLPERDILITRNTEETNETREDEQAVLFPEAEDQIIQEFVEGLDKKQKLSSFVKNDKSQVNRQNNTSDNIENGVIHDRLFPASHRPEEHDQGQDPGKNVKSYKIHSFSNPIFDNFTAIPKNTTVMAMPIEKVSQGILPAAPGTKTPITNEAKISLEQSRKKSDIIFDSSLATIKSKFNTQNNFVNMFELENQAIQEFIEGETVNEAQFIVNFGDLFADEDVLQNAAKNPKERINLLRQQEFAQEIDENKFWHILGIRRGGKIEDRMNIDENRDKNEVQIQKKIDDLYSLKRKIEKDELPDVINFGDKHGKADDLERILHAAQEAAQNGRKLEIVGHGDVFDRGMRNHRNFVILRQLVKIAEENHNIGVNLCFGNHDVMLIQGVLLDDRDALVNWLFNGGAAFLKEMGIAHLRDPNDRNEVERVIRGNPRILRRLIEDNRVKRLAQWLLTNLKLFHVDERAFLHLHAGIPSDGQGNPLITRQGLEELQDELLLIQKQAKAGVLNKEKAANFFKKAHDIFWAREEDWLNNLCEDGQMWKIEIDDENKQKAIAILNAIRPGLGKNWKKLLINKKVKEILKKNGVVFRVSKGIARKGKIDNFLAHLGVNGIIFGHIHLDELFNLDNRIFCVDVDEGNVGHLIFDDKGVRFNALARSADDPIASKNGVLSNLDEQIVRLKENIGIEHNVDIMNLQKSRQSLKQKDEIYKESVTKKQKPAKFSKDQMRQYELGLNISWADGLFEFFLREDNTKTGALRAGSFKIGGRDIGGVITKKNNGEILREDSVLIKEGDALKIGRDSKNGMYCFIVNSCIYDVGEYQGQFVLVTREKGIQQADFMVSRTLHNNASDIVIQIEQDAVSQTKIRPVLEVRGKEKVVKMLLGKVADSVLDIDFNDTVGFVQGMSLENPQSISKNGVTDIDEIKKDVVSKAVKLVIDKTAIYIDNDLINQYKAFGFKERDIFAGFLNNFLSEEISMRPIKQKELVITVLDTSKCLFEDHLPGGFIGIHRSLFEKLAHAPKTAQKLLKIGIKHELLHEALVVERRVLMEHYQSFEKLLLEPALRKAEEFMRNNRNNLKQAMRDIGLWQEVEKRMLETDLKIAQKLALDVRQILTSGLLPEWASFVNRYIAEDRSAYSDYLKDDLEVQRTKFGLISEKDIVYQKISNIFKKILKSAELENKKIKLYLINSDEVTAYWITDSRAFFMSVGLIKTLNRYLEEQGKTVTQDMVAFILAHEVRHFIQDIETKEDFAEKETSDNRTVSKNREYDADTGGIRISAFAGFNPKASIEVLKFLDAIGDIPFLSSHPKADIRIGEVQKIIQDPGQFLPNVTKKEEPFDLDFLASPYIKEPTRAFLFHEKMLNAQRLDQMAGAIDNINSLPVLEEFLTHYYFRMIYSFCSETAKDEDFVKSVSFLVRASAIASYVTKVKYGSNLASTGDLYHILNKKWKMPLRFNNLFVFFANQGIGQILPPVSDIVNFVPVSEKNIIESLDSEIDEAIESEGSEPIRKKTLLALKVNFKSLLYPGSDEIKDISLTQSHKYNFETVESKSYSSEDEAINYIGDDGWIIETRMRSDGSVYVQYIDKNDLIKNFESFWDLFQERYDQRKRQLRESQFAGIRENAVFGFKEWTRKRYGKLDPPEIVFDIETNRFGGLTSERKGEIQKGREEFFSLYLRFLAAHFINQEIGPFGNISRGGVPAVPHLREITDKISWLVEQSYGQELDANSLELLSVVRYRAVFRGFIPDFDLTLDKMIDSLTEEQLLKVLGMILDSPPWYASTMPPQMTEMLDFGEELKSFQKNFSSFYFKTILKLLEKKKKIRGIDFEDLKKAVELKKKLEFRYKIKIGEIKEVKSLFEYIFLEFRKNIISGDDLDFWIPEIRALEDGEIKELFLRYVCVDYFSKQDYEDKIMVLTRLYPACSIFGNKLLEFLLTTVDYDAMEPAVKQDFLEKFLILFKTDETKLMDTNPQKKPVHQQLSRDYMCLLKKSGWQFLDMVEKMEQTGAVVTQFDLIVDNQDEWKQLSFEDERKITQMVAESKKGYKEYQFVVGTIALSKIREDVPTFLMTDSTKYYYSETLSDGSRDSVYPYKEAMADKTGFEIYLADITQKDNKHKVWLFEGRSLAESIGLILELLPLSRERDKILKNLLDDFMPNEKEIISVLEKFCAIKGEREFPRLSISNSYASTGRPVVDDYTIQYVLGWDKIFGANSNSSDINQMMNIVKRAIPEELKGMPEIEKGLSELEKEMADAKNQIQKIENSFEDKYNLTNPKWGWINTINAAPIKFVKKFLIARNPHFDYFNLMKFGKSPSEKFNYAWKIYQKNKHFFEKDNILIEQKLSELLKLFPDATSLRDHELEKLITREESRITGVEVSSLIQPVQMFGGIKKYEILRIKRLDIDKLSKEQLMKMIKLYKLFFPFMTEGDHQIVLGRKIFEIQKQYFSEIYADFQKGLKEILLIFPEFSLTRDSILDEFTNSGVVKNMKELHQISRYILEEQRLTKEDEIISDARKNELWNICNKLPSREEKADFILWVLSPERPMPVTLERIARDNNVNFDSLPSIILSRTKGEKEKFFYDALRGYNGLFEVDLIPEDRLEEIIHKVMSIKNELIEELLVQKPKSDKALINEKFSRLEIQRDLAALYDLFVVIEQEGGLRIKKDVLAGLGILGINVPEELLKKIVTLDYNGVIQKWDHVETLIAELRTIQEQAGKLRKLLLISSKFGIGKTLNRNFARLEDIAKKFQEIRPIISGLIPLMEDLCGLDVSQIDKIIKNLSDIQTRFEVLSRLKSDIEKHREKIEKILKEINTVFNDFNTMSDEIRVITKILNFAEKTGLSQKNLSALKTLEKMLNFSRDEDLKQFVAGAREMVNSVSVQPEVSPLGFVQKLHAEIHNNRQMERFISQLFPVIFSSGELGGNEGFFRDIFEKIFEEYTTERRIILFNSILRTFSDNKTVNASRAKKVRVLLEQMGVVGVKIGQYLSEQPKLLRGMPDLLEELKDLKKSADTFHIRAVFQLLQEADLLDKVVELRERIGAASIKQVYEVLLDDGTIAAAKFMRPSAEKFLDEDLAVLKKTVNMLREKYPRIQFPVTMIEDIEKLILDELSFEQEAANADEFNKNISKRESFEIEGFKIRVPKILYSSKYVILEELARGITLEDLILLNRTEQAITIKDAEKRKNIEEYVSQKFSKKEIKLLAGYDVEKIQHLLAKEFFKQAFEDGFFHADLHAGNVIITPDREIYLIDCGAAGKIKDIESQSFLMLMVAVNKRAANFAVALLDKFLENKISSNEAAREEIKKAVNSEETFSDKIKTIIRIIGEDNLKPKQSLTMYLRALATSAPFFSALPKDKTKELVNNYLTKKSKWILTLHIPSLFFSREDSTNITGNIIEGFRDTEEKELRKEIEENSSKVMAENADVVRLVEGRCSVLLENKGNIGYLLRNRQVEESLITKVTYALENPRKAFKWFNAIVEGEDRYLLGHESALAVNIVKFLVEKEKKLRINNLVDEYIFHEALENTNLKHREIIDFTSVFFRKKVFKRPNETPLGSSLRKFIQESLEPVQIELAPIEEEPVKEEPAKEVPIKKEIMPKGEARSVGRMADVTDVTVGPKISTILDQIPRSKFELLFPIPKPEFTPLLLETVPVKQKSDIASRQAVTVEALNGEPRERALDPVALVGLPESVKSSEVALEDLKREIGRGLAKSGHGDPTETHKVDFFFISQNTVEDTKTSINEILDKYEGRQLVLFAPETGSVNIKSDGEYMKKLKDKFGEALTIVADAYTDLDFSLKEDFVDIDARIAIARLIGWYKHSENWDGKLEAMTALRNYLAEITGEDIVIPEKDMNNLNLLLERLLLRIRPVDYNGDITKWEESQKALATSL
ncbi:MAG: AarF/UbiB family protein [Candidatus Omnitrophota bacterium]